jgi:hypothetical protein
MVQLVVVYRVIANANVRTEKRPVFELPLSLMSCITTGERTAATYLDEHPEWRLAKFRCEVGVPEHTQL